MDADNKKWKCFREEYNFEIGKVERHEIVEVNQTNQEDDVYFNVVYEADEIHSFSYKHKKSRKPKIEFISKTLTSILQDIYPENNIRVKKAVYAKEIFLWFEMSREIIVKKAESSPEIECLLTYINSEFEKVIETKRRMLEEKKVSFDMLWTFYMPKLEVLYQCNVSGETLGGTISSAFEEFEYDESRKKATSTFIININVIEFDGVGLKRCIIRRNINDFFGETSFVELPVILSEYRDNDTIRNDIIKNGCQFFEYCTPGNKLRHYSGYIMRWKDNKTDQLERLYTDGRVMIDHASFATMMPDYPLGNSKPPRKYQIELNRKNNLYLEPEEFENHYFFASATVYGFSFSLKTWGQFEVTKFMKVNFDKNILNYLVMSDFKKKLLQGLVKSYRPYSQTKTNDSLDPIRKKGDGLIILCHGQPGTGKTFTAESVAESLKRPLWVLGVHELGTDPAKLEYKLDKVFEIAYNWNAILLLDEADIYLERRTTSDLARNMLVGLFLRMLEYYQGILFLTTNRGYNFDEAICSRINLFLSFPPLDKEARSEIWTKLMDRAKLKLELTNELLDKELNGREIRNVLHIARMFAKNKQEDLTIKHVITIIDDYKADLVKLKSNGSQMEIQFDDKM